MFTLQIENDEILSDLDYAIYCRLREIEKYLDNLEDVIADDIEGVCVHSRMKYDEFSKEYVNLSVIEASIFNYRLQETCHE